MTAEVLFAEITYDFAIANALDWKLGADVSIVIGGVEPVREGKNARCGREGNLDRNRDLIIVCVEGQRSGGGGLRQKCGRDDKKRGRADLHCDFARVRVDKMV